MDHSGLPHRAENLQHYRGLSVLSGSADEFLPKHRTQRTLFSRRCYSAARGRRTLRHHESRRFSRNRDILPSTVCPCQYPINDIEICQLEGNQAEKIKEIFFSYFPEKTERLSIKSGRLTTAINLFPITVKSRGINLFSVSSNVHAPGINR